MPIELQVDYCPSCGEHLIKNDGVVPKKCPNCAIDVRRYIVAPDDACVAKTRREAMEFVELLQTALLPLRFEGHITQNTFDFLRSATQGIEVFLEQLPDDTAQTNNT